MKNNHCFSSVNKCLTNREKVNALLIDTLSEIYTIKVQLDNYLHLMIKLSSSSLLKRCFINSASDIQTQLLRINLMFNLLHVDHRLMNLPVTRQLNLKGYLLASIAGLDKDEIDFHLLTHMILIEDFEISAYYLLCKLAIELDNNTLLRFLNTNLKQSKAIKKQLEELVSVTLT